jgi:hypothetical protein
MQSEREFCDHPLLNDLYIPNKMLNTLVAFVSMCHHCSPAIRQFHHSDARGLCQSQFLILEGRRFGLGLVYIFTLLSSRFRDGLEEEEERTS